MKCYLKTTPCRFLSTSKVYRARPSSIKIWRAKTISSSTTTDNRASSFPTAPSSNQVIRTNRCSLWLKDKTSKRLAQSRVTTRTKRVLLCLFSGLHPRRYLHIFKWPSGKTTKMRANMPRRPANVLHHRQPAQALSRRPAKSRDATAWKTRRHRRS